MIISDEFEENNNIKQYLKQILRAQATCNLTLQDIKQRLSKLEESTKSSNDSFVDDNSLIAEYLPLSNTNKIKEFENLIHNSEEAKAQLKRLFLKVGGNNPRDNIHRTLKKVFTDNCCINCSWKGIRNNFRIMDLNLITIMRKETISRYKTLTEADFDNTVAEWIRFGKQRKIRHDAKNNEGSDNINN
ncbi:uncharacterized protein [Prorops nasuta]|uniref:uncharacterized protein n=1 Tax=Prorops nasuta TaxID=863751 RepID=UPI0034CFA9A2